jgi:hypothetical protein
MPRTFAPAKTNGLGMGESPSCTSGGTAAINSGTAFGGMVPLEPKR